MRASILLVVFVLLGACGGEDSPSAPTTVHPPAAPAEETAPGFDPMGRGGQIGVMVEQQKAVARQREALLMPSAPITTGFPIKSGRCSRPTDTKNVSKSRQQIRAFRFVSSMIRFLWSAHRVAPALQNLANKCTFVNISYSGRKQVYVGTIKLKHPHRSAPTR